MSFDVQAVQKDLKAAKLDGRLFYGAQSRLQEILAKLVGDAQSIAMQYSARNAIPYVSMVDAGTVELVRSVGPKIFSSADLVQKYEACWTAEQLESHLAAGEAVDRIIREAFQVAAKGARDGKPLTEFDLKQWILREFDAAGVTTEEGPDVAVGPNASDPHYGPVEGKSASIREGELLL